jgi:hypothetical protein
LTTKLFAAASRCAVVSCASMNEPDPAPRSPCPPSEFEQLLAAIRSAPSIEGSRDLDNPPDPAIEALLVDPWDRSCFDSTGAVRIVEHRGLIEVDLIGCTGAQRGRALAGGDGLECTQPFLAVSVPCAYGTSLLVVSRHPRQESA